MLMDSESPHNHSPSPTGSELSSLNLHLDKSKDHTDTSISSTYSHTSDTTITLTNGDSSSSEDESFSSSSSTPRPPSLQSLAKFIHTNFKPFSNSSSGGGYDSYATSYITSAIPRMGFYPDDTASFTGEPPPFPEPVRVKEYEVREKKRKELGESSRRAYIIPDSKPIIKEINLGKETKSKKSKVKGKKDLAKQNRFLYEKARQWCEINKALYVDDKYPKIGPKIIRQKYSDEHRIACQKVKRSSGLSDKDKIYTPSIIQSFPIPLELVTKEKVEDQEGKSLRRMSQQVEDEEKGQIGFRQKLSSIFEDIRPIPNSTVTEDNLPWQFVARKTTTIKPVQVKKPPFRRTEYPPVSKIQKIAQLRKLLPPPKPPEMETDYLSGIWEPVLDIDEFHITPPSDTTQSQGTGGRGQEEDESKVEIEWTHRQEIKEKCKRWLDDNPDIL